MAIIGGWSILGSEGHVFLQEASLLSAFSSSTPAVPLVVFEEIALKSALSSTKWIYKKERKKKGKFSSTKSHKMKSQERKKE